MSWFRWMKNEIEHVLPVFFFFLFFFTLINMSEVYLFEMAGIAPFGFLEVVIAAALIAKIVLVVDHLPITGLFRKRPLAYGIFWKTALYWVLLLIVRFFIRFVPFLLGGGSSLEGDYAEFEAHFNWQLFLSIQIFYLMLLFIFVTFEELTFKIGPEKMRRLFFG